MKRKRNDIRNDMRKYILTNTTNENFKQLENKECEFSYSGGGVTMDFSSSTVRTSMVYEITINQESEDIYFQTKNSEYCLKRIKE